MTVYRQLATVAQHLTAAATRTRKAIEALRAAGREAPPDALALLSDLDAAALGMQAATQPPAALTVTIIGNTKGNPPGKVADAELHFAPAIGCLGGLKLIGFAVWERRTGSGHRVTFPARQYSVNGERRSFALLRPSAYAGGSSPDQTIRDLILDAYGRHTDGPFAQAADQTSSHDYDQDGRPWMPPTSTPPAPPAGPAPLETPPQAAQSTEITAPQDDPPISAYDDSTPGTTLAQAAHTISQDRRLDAGIILGSAMVQAAQAPTARPRRF